MNTLKEKEYIISITGYARLFVKPNYFTINISLECVSNTMESALGFINEDMANLFRLTDSIGIKKDLINIVDLNFDLEYEWKKSTYVFMGYKVEQEVIIEMDITNENEAMAKTLVGRITSMLSNLKQCKINYALKNKKEHLSKVRELAFTDALEKAEQYAKLAKVKIVGTNTISDVEPVEEYSRTNMLCESSNSYDSIEDTNLPNGKKIVLENTVYVTFDIGKK